MWSKVLLDQTSLIVPLVIRYTIINLSKKLIIYSNILRLNKSIISQNITHSSEKNYIQKNNTEIFNKLSASESLAYNSFKSLNETHRFFFSLHSSYQFCIFQALLLSCLAFNMSAARLEPQIENLESIRIRRV